MVQKAIAFCTLLLFTIAAAGCGGSSPPSSQSIKSTINSQSKKTGMAWNSSEPDIAKNGNLAVAVSLLKPLNDASIRGMAVSADPATVKDTPKNYYGKMLKIKGEVIDVRDYAADSDVVKALGGRASQVILTSGNAILVNFIYLGQSSDILVGDDVMIFGYPVGTAAVEGSNAKATALALVGKAFDRTPN